MFSSGDGYELDLSAPEFVIDPYRTYARLRANRGVYYRSPACDRAVPVLSRYADVRLALSDSRFAARPPGHGRSRSLATPACLPSAIPHLAPAIGAAVEQLLQALAGSDGFDALSEFAARLPALVLCEILGVPPAERGTCLDWSGMLSERLAHGDAGGVLPGYVRYLTSVRRQAPPDQPLEGLPQAADADLRLTEEEQLTRYVMPLLGGQDMTVNLIGNGLLALLTHRGQLTSLRRAPHKAETGIDELLRFDSPLQYTARTTLAEIELPEGDVIRGGELVTVLIGAANRDYQQFVEPDQLDLDRPNAPRHLAFGVGRHACPGASLARLEAQIAIRELVCRRPTLRLAQAPLRWRATPGQRGLASLPVAT